MMQQRVLVTGGTGFIGSAVVRYLIGESKASVLNVDNSPMQVISIRWRPLLIRLTISLLIPTFATVTKCSVRLTTISRLKSCIWQQRAMSIDPLMVHLLLSKPTSSARICCLKSHGTMLLNCQVTRVTYFDSYIFQTMRCMAIWLASMHSLPKTLRISQAHRILHRRHRIITWCDLGIDNVGFQS